MDENDVILVEWKVKSVPVRSFPGFASLPAELRRMVYVHKSIVPVA